MLRHFLIACPLFLSPAFATAAEDMRARCGPDGEQIIAVLEKDWGESVKAIALNSRNHMVRWLSNDDTGTWSMVVSMPNGAGCLTASGKHFEIIPTVLGDPS